MDTMSPKTAAERQSGFAKLEELPVPERIHLMDAALGETMLEACRAVAAVNLDPTSPPSAEADQLFHLSVLMHSSVLDLYRDYTDLHDDGLFLPSLINWQRLSVSEEDDNGQLVVGLSPEVEIGFPFNDPAFLDQILEGISMDLAAVSSSANEP